MTKDAVDKLFRAAEKRAEADCATPRREAAAAVRTAAEGLRAASDAELREAVIKLAEAIADASEADVDQHLTWSRQAADLMLRQILPRLDALERATAAVPASDIKALFLRVAAEKERDG